MLVVFLSAVGVPKGYGTTWFAAKPVAVRGCSLAGLGSGRRSQDTGEDSPIPLIWWSLEAGY